MKKQMIQIILIIFLVLGITGCDSDSDETPGENPGTEINYAEIKGKAIYQNLSDSSGIQITLLKTKEGATTLQDQITTSADGSYHFTKVDLGQYTLIASSKDSSEKAQTQNIEILKSEVTQIADLILTPTGEIIGQVMLADEISHEGILVYLLGTSYSAYTDTDGKYTFSDVPVGSYKIKYSFSNYTSNVPLEIKVEKSNAAKIDKVILPKTSTGTGDTEVMCGGNLSGSTQILNPQATRYNSNSDRSFAKKLSNILTPSLFAGSTDKCLGCGIKVWPENGDSSSSGITGKTDVTTGDFEVSNLPPNIYRIEISSEADTRGVVRKNIIVKCGKTTNAGTLSLASLGNITGSVLLDGETDHQDILVKIPGTSHIATTAADGTYTINFLPAGTYQLHFSKTGFAKKSLSIDLEKGATQTAESQTLTTAFGTIWGTVKLNKSTNSSSALISLDNTGEVVFADADGNYSFSNVPSGTYTLFIHASGYAADKLEKIVVTAGATTTPSLVTLEKNIETGNIFGVVQLENGGDPTGTTVLVLETGQSTVVNLQGGFLLSGLEAGLYNLEIHQDKFSTYQLKNKVVLVGVSTATGTTALSLIRANLQGIAILKNETDHADIIVKIEGAALSEDISTDTDSAGNFAFNNIPLGDFNLTFTKEKFVEKQLANVAIQENSVNRTQTINLNPLPGVLSGKVTLEISGDLVSGIAVNFGGLSVNTDSVGAFTFPTVDAGTHSLSISHGNYTLFTQSIVIGAGETVVLPDDSIVLNRKKGGVKGVVLLNLTSNHNQIAVSIDELSKNTLTDAAGNYLFEDVPTGTYQISFSKEKYQPKTLNSVSVVVDQRLVVPETTLAAKPGSVSGIVLLENETNHDNITLQIGTDKTTYTAINGSYSISGVAAGSHTIKAVKNNYLVWMSSITVTPEQTLTIDTITLNREQGGIKGVVQLQGAVLHEEILVSLENTLYLTQTDTGGNYLFENIPTGSYNILFNKVNYNSSFKANQTVVKNDQAFVTKVELIPKPGSISGKIQLEGETSHSEVHITIGNSAVFGDSTADGSFVIENVPSGARTVTFTKSGFETYQKEISLSPNGTYIFPEDIALSFQVGALRGVATLQSGSNHSGITVSVQDTTLTTQTDAAGNYSITGVKTGTWNVAFSKSNYDSVTSSGIAITEGTNVQLSAVELPVKPGTFSGTFLKSSFTNHAGISVSVGGKSGITDSNGAVSIGDVPAGNITLSAVADNFTSYSKTIEMPANGSYNMADPVSLEPVRGKIAGKVTLQGLSDYTGVSVSLLGTTLSTTTNSEGEYALMAPVGNYAAGVRLAKTHFRTKDHVPASAITVTEAGTANITTQTLEQIANDLSGQLSMTADGFVGLKVRIKGIAGTATAGVDMVVDVNSDGSWNVEGLPLGDYIITSYNGDDSKWEDRNTGITVVVGEPVVVDPIVLEKNYIRINDGAEYTTSATVELKLGAVDATQMCIGNLENLSDCNWEAIASLKEWTLPNEGTNNTVYVQYKKVSDQVITTLNDSIYLDSVAAISEVFHSAGSQTLKRGDTIHFKVNANGETGGIAEVFISGYLQDKFRLSDHGLQGDSTADDGIYEGNYTITSGTDISDATVSGYFKDQYGNTASDNAAQSISIGTEPNVSGLISSPSTVAGSAAISWITDEPATTELRYGTDLSYGTLVKGDLLKTVHQTTLTGLDRGTIYHYKVKVKDAAGYEAETADKTFRVAPPITVGLNAYAGDTEISLVWSPSTVENIAGYTLYRSISQDGSYIKQNTTLIAGTVFVDESLTNGTAYFYKITAKDTDGLESAMSDPVSATPIASLGTPTVPERIVAKNTVWSAAGNPWEINGDLVIESGASLFILPGTEVVFQGAFKILVEGELQINGTIARPVAFKAASGQQWKGVVWKEGATGAQFKNGAHQSGSALRNAIFTGAGLTENSEPFAWLRLEKGVGLYLENATFADCGKCLVAENLDLWNDIVIRGGTWSNGEINLTQGGVSFYNTSMQGMTLTQTEGKRAGVIENSTFINSTFDLTRGMIINSSTWSGGTFKIDRGINRHEITKGWDQTVARNNSYTETTFTVDELDSSSDVYNNGTTNIGRFSVLNDFSLVSNSLTTFSSTSQTNITLKKGTITDSSVTISFGLVEDNTFAGTSPLNIMGGLVQNNQFTGNSITGTHSSYSVAVLNNTIKDASVKLYSGLVKGNTITNGAIEIKSSSENDRYVAEVIDNQVGGATGSGIRLDKIRNIILVGNQVTGCDIGLSASASQVNHFQAYDNTITGNRIGIEWNAGCSTDCELTASRLNLQNNTEKYVTSTLTAGSQVNLVIKDTWWGTTNPSEIQQKVDDRFTDGENSTKKVGLYFNAWVSGITTAAGSDADSDGVLDILDGDDDNDGYCDAQEARLSRLDLQSPSFYSSLNSADFPAGDKDCDADGIIDSIDPDDDNDGLVDTVEIAQGSNVFSSDTDGDGIADSFELDNLYDMVDNRKFPISTPRGYLSETNLNTNGISLVKEQWSSGGPAVIEKGQILKFATNTGLTAYGGLYVQGTTAVSTTFTSAQQVPAAGDWNRIESVQYGTRMSHASIKYAGQGGFKGIQAGIFDNIIFESNTNTGDGGGLRTIYSLVQNSQFIKNMGTNGGGAYCVSCVVTGSSFEENTSSVQGGGLYGRAIVTNSNFDKNSANEGGGAHYITVFNSTFSNNHANSSGGAIHWADYTISSEFTNNTSQNSGGAIADSNGVIVLSLFTGNYAENYGGVVKGDSNIIHTSSFMNNYAQLKGGVIYGASNTIEKSNLVSNIAMIANVQSGTINNQVINSYLAGNNGASVASVDVSEGTQNNSSLPQWQGVDVSKARLVIHPDAPELPIGQAKFKSYSVEGSFYKSGGNSATHPNNPRYKLVISGDASDAAKPLYVNYSSTVSSGYIGYRYFILDESGTGVKTGYYSGVSSFQLLDVSLPPGIYTYVISTEASGSIGEYSLKVSGEISEFSLLSHSESLDGYWDKIGGIATITQNNLRLPKHRFRIMEKNSIQFALTTSLDGVLYLKDASGDTIASSAALTDKKSLQLELNPGWYSIIPITESTDSTGTYSLAITGVFDNLSGETILRNGSIASSGGDSTIHPNNPKYKFIIAGQNENGTSTRRINVRYALTNTSGSSGTGYRYYILNSENQIVLSGFESNNYATAYNKDFELEPGQYTFVVSTYYGAVSGDYTFTIEGAIANYYPVPYSETLAGYWENTGGSAAILADDHRLPKHTFRVKETNTVQFSMTSPADSFLYLRDASGDMVASSAGLTDKKSLEVELTAGWYSIIPIPVAANSTGDYTLEMTGLVDNLYGDKIERSGSVASSGGSDVNHANNPRYSFVVAGQNNGQSTTRNFNIQYSLTNTGGSSYAGYRYYILNRENQTILSDFESNYIGTAYNKNFSLEPGFYTFVVSTYGSGVSGDYTFKIEGSVASFYSAVNSHTDSANLTGTSSDPSNPNNPNYHLVLQNGGQVNIHLDTGGVAGIIYILNASGDIVAQGNAPDLTATLEAGTYTVVFAPANSGETGTCQINIEGPTGTSIQGAKSISGNWVNSGGPTAASRHNPRYELEMTYPQDVTFKMNYGSITGHWYLLNEAGAAVNNSALAETTITLAAGKYTLVIGTATAGETGTYSMVIDPVDSIKGVELSANGSWSLSAGKDSNSAYNPAFQIETVNSGAIEFTVNPGTIDGYYYLKDAIGEVLLETSENQFDYYGSAPGKYSVVLATETAGQAGEFSLKVSPVDKLQGISRSVTGAWLTSSGQQKFGIENPRYRLEVPTAGPVSFTFNPGTADGYIYILNASTEAIVAKSSDNSFDANLDAGIYEVVLATVNIVASVNYSLNVVPAATLHGIVREIPGQWDTSGGQSATASGNPVFQFKVNNSGPVVIQLPVFEKDAYLYLNNSNTVIAEYDAEMFTEILSAGDYKVVVGTVSNGVSGDFTLRLSGSISAVSSIQNVFHRWQNSGGQNATSVYNPKYPFKVAKPGDVTIAIDSSADSYLYLYKADNTLVIESDLETLTQNLTYGDYYLVLGTKQEGINETYKATFNNVASLTGSSKTVSGSWSNSGGNSYTSNFNPRYRFQTVQNGEVTLTLTPGAVDGYLYILDQNGQVDASGDEDVLKAVLDKGEYTVVLATKDAAQSGPYTLAVNPVVDFVGVTRTASGLWTSSGGRSSTSSDNPKHPFQVASPGEIRISIDSTADAFVYLLDTDGSTVLKESDDDNFVQTLDGVGVYNMVIGTQTAGQTADYILSVSGPVSELQGLYEVSGSWTTSAGKDATSANNPKYEFALSFQTNVTLGITVDQGTASSYLYVLDASEAIIYEGNATRFSKDLAPGSYFIVVGTETAGVSGSFTLKADPVLKLEVK